MPDDPTVNLNDIATSPQDALIYTMVLAAVADSAIGERELGKMSRIVQALPAFEGYDIDRIPEIASECHALLQDVNGIEKVIAVIDEALPTELHETAYALAVDVVAADGVAGQEELRLLEIFRHELHVGRLEAAAIERGAAARHRRIA